MSTAAHARFAETIARVAGVEPDAARAADAVLEVWHGLSDVLSPVFGVRGVRALLKRSLNLASRAHLALKLAGDDGPDAAIDLEQLHRQLQEAGVTAGTAMGAAIFAEFHGVLCSVIGEALTHRLLAPLWEFPSSGNAAQDVKP